MFFMLDLSHNVKMHPRALGPKIEEAVVTRLHQEVEGTIQGTTGYIIAVQSVSDIGKGKVLPYTGVVSFPIKYKAIVLRPFKGEIIDATVHTVNKVGLFANAGPMSVFISTHQLPDDLTYDPTTAEPCFTNGNGSITLSKGTDVRVQIMAVTMKDHDFSLVGSVKKDYLGAFN